MSDSQSLKRIRQEFFKETLSADESGGEGADNISLRSYISRHLENQMQQELEDLSDSPDSFDQDNPDSAAPLSQRAGKAKAGLLSSQLNPFYQSSANDPASSKNGYQLNALDTELSAGIEQYLPTPIVRLRIVKERLVRDIATVERRLEQFRSMTVLSSEAKEKLALLEQRYLSLKAHEAQVSDELTMLLAKQSWVFRLIQQVQHLNHNVQNTGAPLAEMASLSYWMGKLDPQKETLVNLNSHLKDVKEVLADHYQRPSLASHEIAEIVNHYDHVVRELDLLADEIRARKGPWGRFSDVVNGWAHGWIASQGGS
ncbi:MAG: hypothetical protein K2X01_06080 [Cyanobacteria bacterium]|nr:hypothetical protein [Cyanobacteriota bacterium]